MKKTAIKKATNLLLSSSSDANISSVAPADKSQQGQSKNLWWVPDDAQVWILAYAVSGELPNGLLNFETIPAGKTVSFPKHRCRSAASQGSGNGSSTNHTPEDLILLPDVNDASILACTRGRFQQKKIYTGMGQVLMAVNPFEVIPNIYGKDVIQRYTNPLGKGLDAHVYIVPSRAYYNMCHSGKNQSILISGESGAGKTEATKQCLSYLTYIADSSTAKASTTPGDSSSEGIADRIIAASPILESFGNAQTKRNPNSSRFGKWMVLSFDSNNTITSSSIISYLLEKSRVTQRDPQERNYHIFYQILSGLDASTLKEWKMSKNIKNYRYLTTEKVLNLNDEKLFAMTKEAFLKMGFSLDNTYTIFKIVCAVLLLGNIKVVETNNGESSAVENVEVVEDVAEMLNVSPQSLQYSICNYSLDSGKRKSTISVPLNVTKAMDSRDSLARALYDKIFLDIIRYMNLSSHSEEDFDGQLQDRCIGLLDIFGFEIFLENSFEQTCINYCNERLQHHFNYVIFTAEKALYAAENIVCESIEFKDNSEVIKDIESVFKSLDEEGRIPKGSSKKWFEKLKKSAKSSAIITFPTKKVGDIFVVKHYAGDVDYNSMNFLEKNIESLSMDLVNTMASSTDPIVQRLFNISPPLSPGGDDGSLSAKGGASSKSTSQSQITTKTIAWKFQANLNTLMQMLKKTESHFIRCIKSNDACTAQTFDSQLVNKQLLYSGVFEVVKIQQSGLPCRLSHEDFLDRYRCLAPSNIRYKKNGKMNTSNELIKWLKKNGFDLPQAQMGVTMTFFKGQEQRVLELARNKLFDQRSTRMQAWLRCKYVSSIYKRLTVEYRKFWIHCEELKIAEAIVGNEAMKKLCVSLFRLVGYAILQHVLDDFDKEIHTVKKRVELINEATLKLRATSEADILSLNDVISRAIDLELTNHPVIEEGKRLVKKYGRGMEFMSIILSPERISSLSFSDINEGIETLKEFRVIVANADDVISRALEHKRIVEYELFHVLKPMQALLEQCAAVYDGKSGNLVSKNPRTSNLFERITQLRELLTSHAGMKFNCIDLGLLYTDCTSYVRFMTHFVSKFNAVGGLEFLNGLQPTSDIFRTQIEEFRKWADLHMSAVYLQEQLQLGCVPRTDIGGEEDVNVVELERLLRPIELLEVPPPHFISVLQVAKAMLALRKCFVAKNWDQLEILVNKAEHNHVENNIFASFPYCVVELRSCQWQVIYHGLVGDVLFLITEPVFAPIPMDTDNWTDLVSDMSENVALINTVNSFATASSPKLVELVPLLQSLLELRTTIHQKNTKGAKKMIDILRDTQKSVIEQYQLTDTLEEEFKFACRLIDKVEFERLLDKELDLFKLTSYEYNGPNEQVPYSKFCSVTESIESLSAAVSNFDSLGDSFHPELQKKIKFSRAVLKGRELLSRSEEDRSIDWDDALFEYENCIADSCSDRSPQSQSLSMSVDDRATVYIPHFFAPEYNITVQELVRRVLLSGLKDILKHTCVVGKVDIDVHVDEAMLVPLFLKFNTISRMMQMNQDHLPVNIKCLYAFTGVVLKIRKSVLEGKWGTSPIQSQNRFDDLRSKDNDNARALLNKSKTMNHGGGLGIAEVVGELELVRAELHTKDSIEVLTNELESIILTIPDIDDQAIPQQFSDMKASLTATQVDQLMNDKSQLPTVDLNPLKQAMKEARGNAGAKSKKLQSLAVQATSTIILLLSDQSGSVTQTQMDAVIDEYNKNNVNSDAIETVFKTVRIHSFMEHLFFSLREITYSAALFESLSGLQKSVKAMPLKFVPWLKAAYHFCELLSSIESNDWLRIVECSKSLEDNVNFLLSLRSHIEGDKKFEKEILKMLSEKAFAGYKLAISMKAREEGRILPSQSSSPTATAAEDASNTMKARLRLDDTQEPYGITQLRKAGYKDSDIVDLKLPLKFMWAFDMDLILLRKKGYTASKLRAVGYSLSELYNAGFPVDQLKNVGFTATELRAVGATIDQLRVAGFDDKLLIREELSVDVMKAMEYDASKLVRMGLALRELVAAGFPVLELRAAGFTASELKNAGLDDIKALYEGGYDLRRLKLAGFDLHSLKEAGFSFQALRSVNFSDDCLLKVGFDQELERDALMDLFNATGGNSWKIRLNWGSFSALKDWYGLKVEVDSRYRERVVSIDLFDNNLVGTVPERLSLLSKLRYVRLGYNLLRGQIPLLLIHRIRSNSGIADFSNNSALVLPTADDGGVTASILERAQMSPTQSSSAVLDAVFSNHTHRTVILNFEGTDRKGSKDKDKAQKSLLLSPSASMGGMNHPMVDMDEQMNEWEDIERAALMDLFNATNGPRWLNKKNWGHPLKPLSEWAGVSVNRSNQVCKIVLPSNNLTGAIPDSLYYLEALKILDLRYNQLSGPIPQSITNLSCLAQLYLHCNKLSCDIPEDIGKLTQLSILDLRDNQLVGVVPNSVSNLRQLKYLGLKSNRLSSFSKEVNELLPWSRNVL